jgi:hypothetical protein
MPQPDMLLEKPRHWTSIGKDSLNFCGGSSIQPKLWSAYDVNLLSAICCEVILLIASQQSYVI